MPNWSSLNRRDVLHLAVAAHASSAIPSQAGLQPHRSLSPAHAIVDTNVSLFHWPFRRLPLDDSALLVEKMRALGIRQAWAGSFEGLLHRDIAMANQRLANEASQYAELIPIGSINPTLPDWEHDLSQCVEAHRMTGIRLHPNYHGYALNDARFSRLLERAASSGLLVQIAVAMEDVRTQHHLVKVPDVDLSPLPDVVRRIPEARVQILNHRLAPDRASLLAETAGVYFDIARVDGTDAVPKLVAAVPDGRVLFGSHAPFLIPEAALIRVHESDTLTTSAERDVYANNAAEALRNNLP